MKMTNSAIALALLATGPAAAESFNFTVVAGHPPITKGVAGLRDYFIPEVTGRMEEAGHEVTWTEAYAGSVADVSGVLEAVEDGIADFGYVPHLFEGDKLPLEQVTYVTPYISNDLPALMQVITQLHEEIPAMGEAWARHNQKLLAPVGIDAYQFVTDFPIESVEDIQNRKIGTAGLATNWLKETGATPVSLALPTYYNSMSTGLIEGMLTFESAIAPYKFHEVAPIVTKVGIGPKYSSALTVNLDVWEGLPADVQDIMLNVAEEYRERTAQAYADAAAGSLATVEEAGGTINQLDAAAQQEFAAALPNVARQWAEDQDARGLPGTETLETFVRLANEAELEFARDWTAE